MVTVKNLNKLENSDRLQGIPLFGLQAITDLSTKIGDIGIVFPAEAQLSVEYTKYNNLYRHGNLNEDPGKVGYLEDNRRIRAIKLRGNQSDALFMPLESLAFTGINITELKESDEFDTLNDIEICRKYEVARRGSSLRIQVKKDSRVEEKFFPKQTDVTQWLKIVDGIPDDEWVVLTQKLHGSNIRVGNIPVTRKLSLLERLAKRIGIKIQDREYSMVYGSHNVTKDANNPNQRHFYDSDVWTQAGQAFNGLIPENYIVFGELIGWTESGQPIQKHYTYNLRQSKNAVYIYRVLVVNNQGITCDLSWDAVCDFADSIGIPHVSELWRGRKRDIMIDRFLDTKYREDGFSGAVPLAPDSPCDEGIVIRLEKGMQPVIYKAKSPVFLGHETRMLDENIVDLEEQSDVVTEPV